MKYYIGSMAYGHDDIQHFGILGMKWGVRRYQNPDGSLTDEGRRRYDVGDQRLAAKNQKRLNKLAKNGRPNSLSEAHTIPKGTMIYRTTSTESDTSGDGPKYVSYLDVDRDHYKGGYIRNRDRADKAYEHSYVSTTDIKVPGREELKEVINKAVQDNKLEKETSKAWFDMAFPPGTWTRYEYLQSGDEAEVAALAKKEVTRLIEKYKTMTPNEAYFFAAQSLGLNKKLGKIVFSELKKRGYNAITDEASVGGQSGWSLEGADPLIVFDASILESAGSKEISAKDEDKARQKFNKWETAARRNRK